MKKLFLIILATLSAAVLCSCSAEKLGEEIASGFETDSDSEKASYSTDGNNFSDIDYSSFTKPSDFTDAGFNEETWCAYEVVYQILYKDKDTYIVAEFELSDEYAEMSSSLSIFDDDYDEKMDEILSTGTLVRTADVSSQIPNQAFFDSFVGKTVRDLENAGFESSGYYETEDSYILCYSEERNIVYCDVEVSEKIEDMDDYSKNDIRALTITSISFDIISSNILFYEFE